jgi:hypothetical protein
MGSVASHIEFHRQSSLPPQTETNEQVGRARLHCQGVDILPKAQTITPPPPRMPLRLPPKPPLTSPTMPNYAVVGFDGHGINSWAVHYYLVDDALALFIQLAWGGAYVDADQASRGITGVFAWAEKLQAEIRRTRSDGLIPPGWRLLVVVSQFAQSGWAWVPSPPPGPEAIDWHDSHDLRAAIDKSLADLRAGRINLG